MSASGPKPGSMNYGELIELLLGGRIKIPRFQRDFVWSLADTAKLLDSILKGYPIGTFILWETDEPMCSVKNVGNINVKEVPEGTSVMYVLDGQQRITSLFAALRGAEVPKFGEKKLSDFKKVYISLGSESDHPESQIITEREPEMGSSMSLYEMLSLSDLEISKLSENFSDDEAGKIIQYRERIKLYPFSTITLKCEGIDTAIEVFTRINTGGKTLTLFEIMAAKTFEEKRRGKKGFDLQEEWRKFISLLDDKNFGDIGNAVVLHLLSLFITKGKRCDRKTILSLKKEEFVEFWPEAISMLGKSIEYFRKNYGVEVSSLLPYDSLLVPFSYFFHRTGGRAPNSTQRELLKEFFWRTSLTERYSSSTETKLAQDAGRIDSILKNTQKGYKNEDDPYIDPEDLIETVFKTSDSYCKAVLCALAIKRPRDFDGSGKVTLDNSHLKISSSKNYHHFFPKGYLKKRKIENENCLVNITLVSDHLNKVEIRDKAPSNYIGRFETENPDIDKDLKSHFIKREGFGIDDDDYELFLDKRARLISKALKKLIEPKL